MSTKGTATAQGTLPTVIGCTSTPAPSPTSRAMPNLPEAVHTSNGFRPGEQLLQSETVDWFPHLSPDG